MTRAAFDCPRCGVAFEEPWEIHNHLVDAHGHSGVEAALALLRTRRPPDPRP